jgi:hypothetical protein
MHIAEREEGRGWGMLLLFYFCFVFQEDAEDWGGGKAIWHIPFESACCRTGKGSKKQRRQVDPSIGSSPTPINGYGSGEISQ